jgi:hypothetical protein
VARNPPGTGGTSRGSDEGGTAGEPDANAAGRAGSLSGIGGEGGEGGQLTCFEVVDDRPRPEFFCKELSAEYDPGTRRITLGLLPGTEPTVAGTFSVYYPYKSATGDAYTCANGTIENTGSALELSADFAGDPERFFIPHLALQDACGSQLEMQNESTEIGLCIGIYGQRAGGGWEVTCSEQSGKACQASASACVL